MLIQSDRARCTKTKILALSETDKTVSEVEVNLTDTMSEMDGETELILYIP